MKSGTYSLVTIVFPGEAGFMRMQARSLSLYLPREMIKEIIVIVNQPPMPTNWQAAVQRAYGDLAGRVRFVSADALTNTTHLGGWWSQQLLKLLIARHVNTDYYIALDAKNHLVFPLTDNAIEGDSKPKMFMQTYLRHPLRPHFEAAMAYFHLPPQTYLERFVSTTTPFIIPTELCRNMMAYIETREGQDFAAAFRQLRLTEFFMLGGYLCHHAALESVYDLSGRNYQTIWIGLAGTDRLIANTIRHTTRTRGAFFSVHRKALPILSRQARRMVVDFWVRRALFPNRSFAHAYLRKPNA